MVCLNPWPGRTPFQRHPVGCLSLLPANHTSHLRLLLASWGPVLYRFGSEPTPSLALKQNGEASAHPAGPNPRDESSDSLF